MTAQSLHPAASGADRRAFTLLELLVVITIIGVLAGLAFAAGGAVMTLVKKQQARNDANQIVMAVNQYYTDYGRYPLEDHGSDVEQMESDAKFMSVLLGLDDELNPKGLTYFEGKEAKDGKGGFVSSGGQGGRYVDPWGEMYLISIDGNYDDEVKNPDPNAENDTLRKGVIVWSKGEDNDQRGGGEGGGGDIWKDNVKSWE